MSAAVAEESWWAPYEHAHYELREGVVPPAYSSFDPEKADATIAGARAAIMRAIKDANGAEECEEGSGRTLVARPGEPSDWGASERVSSALREALWMTPMDEDSEAAEEEAAEEMRTMLALEVQIWLELDALLQAISLASGNPDAMPAPIQLLGLMLPPPEGGWPESFALMRVVAQLEEMAALDLDGTFSSELLSSEPYVPAHACYPPRRRVQQLSHAVWPVLANFWGGLEMQPALEVESTCDRLRLLLIRLRVLKGQIEDKGYGDLV